MAIHGPRNRSLYQRALVALMLMLGLAPAFMSAQAPLPADSQQLGTAAMFLGWRGESAILRQE